jgi:hypothetical protein
MGETMTAKLDKLHTKILAIIALDGEDQSYGPLRIAASSIDQAGDLRPATIGQVLDTVASALLEAGASDAEGTLFRMRLELRDDLAVLAVLYQYHDAYHPGRKLDHTLDSICWIQRWMNPNPTGKR